LSIGGVAAQGEPAVSALCFPTGTRGVAPTISTNGERAAIIFDRTDEGGGAMREVMRIPGGAFTEAFLPDGRLLMIISNHFGAYDLERRHWTELPPIKAARYELSPDGKMVAANDLETRVMGYVRPLAGGETVWLRRKSGGETIGSARFSPD